jgi:integrase
VFLIPAERVKNGEERLVVLNTVARSVVEGQRGQHPKYVFTYCGERQKKINNSGWQGARKRAGLSQVRVHDLKHYSEFRIIPSRLLDTLIDRWFSVTYTPLTA